KDTVASPFFRWGAVRGGCKYDHLRQCGRDPPASWRTDGADRGYRASQVGTSPVPVLVQVPLGSPEGRARVARIEDDHDPFRAIIELLQHVVEVVVAEIFHAIRKGVMEHQCRVEP